MKYVRKKVFPKRISRWDGDWKKRRVAMYSIGEGITQQNILECGHVLFGLKRRGRKGNCECTECKELIAKGKRPDDLELTDDLKYAIFVGHTLGVDIDVLTHFCEVDEEQVGRICQEVDRKFDGLTVYLNMMVWLPEKELPEV